MKEDAISCPNESQSKLQGILDTYLSAGIVR